MRLTRYEQNIKYGVNEIGGRLPIGYLALKSALMARGRRARVMRLLEQHTTTCLWLKGRACGDWEVCECFYS